MLSHIELNVSDLEASTRFYCSVLEPLGFQKADGADGEYARLSMSPITSFRGRMTSRGDRVQARGSLTRRRDRTVRQ